MIHLGRHLKFQSFASVIVQPVSDHFNFLILDIFYRELLRHILPQQTIEALIIATIPVRKAPRKVPQALARLINQTMPAGFFAVVAGQGL